MSPFAVLALCVQACLIQAVMSQCGCGSSIRNVNLPPVASYGSSILGSNLGRGSSLGGTCGNNYGGAGLGQVAAVGDVSACGETVVVGSVPVIGEAYFNGNLPATGYVYITGQCGCGCNYV